MVESIAIIGAGIAGLAGGPGRGYGAWVAARYVARL
jgi:predicted NAD/FAD-dependent oxidoreductase